MNESIKISRLTADDAIHGLRLSTQAGWNQTLSEWNLILNDSNSICIGAELDDQIVATAAAINYNPDFTWIAMVLTDIKFRRRGISKLVLTALLKTIGNKRTIKLDATPAGQALYSQFGFKAEYKIFRFVGSTFPGQLYKNKKISLALKPHYQDMILSDMAQFGANRSIYFDWIKLNFSSNSYLIFDSEKITGFICGREGKNYMHLGPMLCSKISEAIDLLQYSLGKKYKLPVIVDVPESKSELIHWLESNGFIQQRAFVRMYKNGNTASDPVLDSYLIAGPEFG